MGKGRVVQMPWRRAWQFSSLWLLSLRICNQGAYRDAYMGRVRDAYMGRVRDAYMDTGRVRDAYIRDAYGTRTGTRTGLHKNHAWDAYWDAYGTRTVFRWDVSTNPLCHRHVVGSRSEAENPSKNWLHPMRVISLHHHKTSKTLRETTRPRHLVLALAVRFGCMAAF